MFFFIFLGTNLMDLAVSTPRYGNNPAYLYNKHPCKKEEEIATLNMSISHKIALSLNNKFTLILSLEIVERSKTLLLQMH